MKPIITPPEEGIPILSQIATTRLSNSREVALRGNNLLYWSFVRFYTVLGCMDNRLISMLHNTLSDQADADTMATTDILSRVSSIASESQLIPSEVGGYRISSTSSLEDVRQSRQKEDGVSLLPSSDALTSQQGIHD